MGACVGIMGPITRPHMNSELVIRLSDCMFTCCVAGFVAMRDLHSQLRDIHGIGDPHIGHYVVCYLLGCDVV
jgi:hypothetical protein